MQLQHPFRVITPSVDGDVLQAVASIRTPLTAPQLTRLIPDRSRTGILLAADRLASQGLLQIDLIGRNRSYRLNDTHLLAGAVRAIAEARASFMNELRQLFVSSDAVYVALFGSAAAGTMGVDSDIDIAVIRHTDPPPHWDDRLAAAAERITLLTGNDARLIDIDETDVGRPEFAGLIDEIIANGITVHGDAAPLRAARNRGRHQRSA